ncbi:hypothetical protein SDC9_190044 [bioreactor metagenome]|uniref:Amino-acid carrier protein AlsT n=1 Tax=bioreactor metagenome TaxID=1076179 RepID=A0A645HU34_9ZZZZ
MVGAAAGITFKTMVTKGIGRGVFSNEAGLGSAAIAHAATSETKPVKQGIYGVLEVFLDTIVICTLTALVLLISGVDLPFGGVGASGFGAYHGKWSFDTFTHYKAVMVKADWLDLPMRYPPNLDRNLGLLRLISK